MKHGSFTRLSRRVNALAARVCASDAAQAERDAVRFLDGLTEAESADWRKAGGWDPDALETLTPQDRAALDAITNAEVAVAVFVLDRPDLLPIVAARIGFAGRPAFLHPSIVARERTARAGGDRPSRPALPV